MRIGLSSIYAWRPHVEHLAYLSDLLAGAGHVPYFLVCDAQLPSCYTRELKGTNKIRECAPCIAGGLRSFDGGFVDNLKLGGPSMSRERAKTMALSSAKTLFRTEAAEDVKLPGFKELHERLVPAVQRVYRSARAWIEGKQIDALLIFNGRIDATSALLEAGIDSGIPVTTVERTWFSDGLLLVPNDGPLDLKQHHRLNRDFRDRPLSEIQALLVAQRIASRFERTNDSEWRAYNKNPIDVPWPANSRGLKVLILPSSRNEVDGHPDWDNGWQSFSEALDVTMAHVGAQAGSAVLRCHPVWGERIGVRTGELSEKYYSSWAKARGIYTIPSTDRTSSLSLMAQADLIIVNGGSAVFEAAALGKPSITLGPGTYSEAGFCGKVFSPSMLKNCESAMALSAKELRKRSLRAAYTHNFRHSQFTEYVKAITPTDFEYFEGADVHRLVNIFGTGQLSADDDSFADDSAGEDVVCDLIASHRWKDLARIAVARGPKKRLQIQRRAALRWLNTARKLAARGDA